jgi:hypothetical protein
LIVVYGIAGIGDKAVKAQSSNIEESRRPYCESKKITPLPQFLFPLSIPRPR